ncbi:MAG TPA: hypothetical protein VF060_27210 [Trebonia sp.]
MSEMIDDTRDLERGYRRLVAFYPRSFRRENGDEIIAVLLATAACGQRRPGLAESFDLLRGALRMRLGLSHAPRTMLYAARLMYLGALAEVGTLTILLLTWPAVQEGVLAHNSAPRQPNVLSTLETARVADIFVLACAAGIWLVLAWANGRGYQVARLAALFCLLFYTLALGSDLAEGVAKYAPAAVAASGVTWAIGLACVILICWKQSWPHYERRSA